MWNTLLNAMPKGVRSKVIQVPIDAELLSSIDETARLVSESRAEFIREACRNRLQSFLDAALDRRYVRGYRKTPVLLLSRDAAYAVRTAITVAPLTRTIRDIPVEVALDL